MKLKSKHKWTLVGLVFVLSLVCTFSIPMFSEWPLAVVKFLSFVLVVASGCYGAMGLSEYKVFERFFAWLKADDV